MALNNSTQLSLSSATPVRRIKRKNDGDLSEIGTVDELVCEIKDLKAIVLESNDNIKLILNENKYLKAELEILKSVVSKISVTGNSVSNEIKKIVKDDKKVSYSEIVKKSAPVVVIVPKDVNQKSDKTKSEIKSKNESYFK